MKMPVNEALVHINGVYTW